MKKSIRQHKSSKTHGSLYKRLVFGLLFFMANLAVSTAQASAIVALRPDRIEAGDTTMLWVMVSGVQAAPGQVDFGAWAGIIPLNNVMSRSDKWRRVNQQWVRQYALIVFDSSTLELPALTVRLAIGDPLKTNSLRLTVRNPPGGFDLSDMETIRDIHREPPNWTDNWPYGVVILILLFLLFLVLRRMAKRPKHTPAVLPAPSAAPAPSPYEHALKELDELKRTKAWQHGPVKEYYAKLSLVLREYLEHRFHIPALESTTGETGQLLQTVSFPADLIPQALQVLAMTDLVKYAQSQPTEHAHEKAIADLRQLVVKSHNTAQATPETSQNTRT